MVVRANQTPEPKNRFLMPREERERILVKLLEAERKLMEEGIMPLIDTVHDAVNNSTQMGIAKTTEEMEDMPDAQRIALEEEQKTRFEIVMRVKTEDEAEAILDQEAEPNKYLYTLFGPENVQALKELVEDDTLRSMDMMILQGELDPGELLEFLLTSDEFADVYKEMRSIIDSMIDELEPKLEYYIKAKNRGNGNLWEGADCLTMEFFILAIKLQLPTDMPLLRNTLMVRFSGMMLQEFYVRLYKYYLKTHPEDYDKRHIILEKGALSLNSIKENEVDDLGEDFQDAFLVTANTYEALNENDKLIQKHPQKLEQAFPKQPEQSEEEWHNQLKELIDVSQTTKLDPFSIKQGDLVVDFNENMFDSPKENRIHLCVVDIHFGRKETLTIFLNRYTGELTMHFDSLPLTDLVSPQTYNAIKSFVYDALTEYYVINPPKEQEERSYTQPKDLLEKLNENVESDNEFFTQIAGVLNSYTDQLERNTRNLDRASKVLLWEEEEGKYARQIRGLSGNVVKGALTRLLGKPLKIEGSHHTFRCRNGNKYPIDFHGKKNVGTGLLIKCLKKYGIPIQEFVDSL